MQHQAISLIALAGTIDHTVQALIEAVANQMGTSAGIEIIKKPRVMGH